MNLNDFLEHFSLSRQRFAELAGVDTVWIDKFEAGELSPGPGVRLSFDQVAAHDKIFHTMLRLIVQRYPEKLEAATRPVLEEAMKYPEGSEMRTVLDHAANVKRYLEPLNPPK
jgi:hypothetical protein